jgi:hypothetical protein
MLSQKVLKPGPVQYVDPELETGRVQEKTWYDPVDPAIRSKTQLQPGQKPYCNQLIFVFLLKRRCFDFFKKKNLTRTTRSKSRT